MQNANAMVQTMVCTSTISLGKTLAEFCAKRLVGGFGGSHSGHFVDMLQPGEVQKQNNNNYRAGGSGTVIQLSS